MLKKINVGAAIAIVALAAFGAGAVPTSALAQGSRGEQTYRDTNRRDAHRPHYSGQARARYNSRHCGSGNGAVGTIAGGAGGALLGNALGGGTLGTVAGGVGGALLGRTLDKQNTRDRNRSRNGC